MTTGNRLEALVPRAFLSILFVSALGGCSGKGDSSSPDYYDVPFRAATPGAQVSDSTERQKLIRAEIDYYLERHDPLDEGFDMVARYAEYGDSSMAVYLPPGRMSMRNLLSLRHGKGLTRDSLGRLIIGRYQADTLVCGVRIDSTGIYAGRMNRHGEASGHGFCRQADGTYYEGHWEHDMRDGFGLSISTNHLKVGTWQHDRFRGEHVSHHSDRIYGIDISRYQHDKGRRHYAIDWNRLRITNLGKRIDKERVQDTVDYPVSFAYIKSTEGVTIENKYYYADDDNARKSGIPVGAYHFFSTKTPPEEQAEHFLEYTRFRPGDMPPMLDIEPSDRQIEEMGGPEVLFDHIRTWLDMVERQTKTRPLLYINQRFVNNYLPLAPDLKERYHFWIARYGEYKPDIHLDIWQLCADGRVQGITPEVDLNVFNGYQGQWEDFLQKVTIP